jgi:hypothetical protein
VSGRVSVSLLACVVLIAAVGCGGGTDTTSVAAPPGELSQSGTYADSPPPARPSGGASKTHAAATAELKDARACLLKAGFPAASTRRTGGVGHVELPDPAGYTEADVNHVAQLWLGTKLGFYSFGIAPSAHFAREWLQGLSAEGMGTFYGGVRRGSAALASTPGRGGLKGNQAYFRQRRSLIPCALAMPAMSGPREVIGSWRHYR